MLYSYQGRVVADPDTLIARGGYGGSNRCSDPTIGASVNHLAALGYAITLADPVGLYIDHLDMTGFTFRDSAASIDPEWFKIIRGSAGTNRASRLRSSHNRVGTVSDVKIAGEPITHGGQLAERMTVKLVGIAALGANFHNRPARFGLNAYITPSHLQMLESAGIDAPPTLSAIPVFNYPEARSAARAPRENLPSRPRRRPRDPIGAVPDDCTAVSYLRRTSPRRRGHPGQRSAGIYEAAHESYFAGLRRYRLKPGRSWQVWTSRAFRMCSAHASESAKHADYSRPANGSAPFPNTSMTSGSMLP